MDSSNHPSSYNLSLTRTSVGVRALFVHDHPPRIRLRQTLISLRDFALDWDRNNPTETIMAIIVMYVTDLKNNVMALTSGDHLPFNRKSYHTSSNDPDEQKHITTHLCTQELWDSRNYKYTIHIYCGDNTVVGDYTGYWIQLKRKRKFSATFGTKVDDAGVNFRGKIPTE